MADDRRDRAIAQRGDQAHRVAHGVQQPERLKVVVVVRAPAGGAAVPALVRGDDMESRRGQRRHDLSPGIGQLGEAVQQQDGGPARRRRSGLEDVHAQAIDAGDEAGANASGEDVTRQRGQFGHEPSQTGASARCGAGGSSTRIGSPGRTSPPVRTMLMTPALRMRLPRSSRPSVAAISPGCDPIQLSARIAQARHLDHRRVAQAQPGAGRQPQQVDAAGGDVLAHLPGHHREPGGPELLVQLGVDQVHLAQVGLVRVAGDARAVLDRLRPGARRLRRPDRPGAECCRAPAWSACASRCDSPPSPLHASASATSARSASGRCRARRWAPRPSRRPARAAGMCPSPRRRSAWR